MVITHIFVGLKTLSFFTNFLGVQRYQGNPTLQPSVDSTVRVVWCVPLHQRRQWCQWVPCAARAQMKVEPELCFSLVKLSSVQFTMLVCCFQGLYYPIDQSASAFFNLFALNGAPGPPISSFVEGPNLPDTTLTTRNGRFRQRWYLTSLLGPGPDGSALVGREGGGFFRVFYGSMFHRFRAPEDTPWGWATQSELWKHPCL